MIPWLGEDSSFPPLSRALREPNGLLAAGGDLSVERLVEAYRRGIFPWFSENDPILWWSPDPRMVLFPRELRISRSLAKTLRKGRFQVTADRAFRAVIQGCSEPRPGQRGTWITAQMIDAYCRLHQSGIAHSLETWEQGRLVGGLYGVALGRAFFGESMFARVSDASKVAFVTLVRQLDKWRFGMIDCQMKTQHLAAFGAREIPRSEFARRLAALVDYEPIPGPWRLDPT
ncbi:MAG TPA: leucyl/phenylalanyl-tRNA--protein transferase [Burkholderiales bacterium]|nr:leucyl/phenylalanyl-tRNA--protein transferase [Burkholderiales bacterium]